MLECIMCICGIYDLLLIHVIYMVAVILCLYVCLIRLKCMCIYIVYSSSGKIVAVSVMVGDTNWYQSSGRQLSNGGPRPVGGWGCYKLVSEHGFNTEPGWAMLVEIEARVLEGVVVEMDKTQVLTHGFNTEPGWAG
jgi:hypothetical protein